MKTHRIGFKEISGSKFMELKQDLEPQVSVKGEWYRIKPLRKDSSNVQLKICFQGVSDST